MPNITYTIPSLLGGVSQQPDSLRRIDQFTQQENLNPSIIDSIKKRAGSEFVTNLAGLSGLTAAAIHVFEASNKEKYFIVATPELFVYKVSDGSAVTVTNPSAFVDYLDTVLSIRNVKFVNIGDTVFFLNTDRATAFETVILTLQ